VLLTSSAAMPVTDLEMHAHYQKNRDSSEKIESTLRVGRAWVVQKIPADCLASSVRERGSAGCPSKLTYAGSTVSKPERLHTTVPMAYDLKNLTGNGTPR